MELLHWLEHFGHSDEQLADKATLVQMLLRQGNLTTPDFLNESEADQYLAQVQRHLAAMKKSVAVTLDQMLKMAQQLQNSVDLDTQRKWWPNGRMAAAFQGTAHPSRPGVQPLSLQPGEPVDVAFHETNGWAWCTSKNGSEGWIPASKVFEIAHVVQEPREENGKEGMLLVTPGEEVEVVLRHYTGWTLCKRFVSSHGNAQEDVGWVPDPCLSDHPRNASTKSTRLVGTALYRLAGDILDAENAFAKIRAQCHDGLMQAQAAGLDAQLRTVYENVLGISEEYHKIQSVLQVHAGLWDGSGNGHGQLPQLAALPGHGGGGHPDPCPKQPRPPALADFVGKPPRDKIPEELRKAVADQPQKDKITEDLQKVMTDLDTGSVAGLSSRRSSSSDSHRSTVSLTSKKVGLGEDSSELASSASRLRLEGRQRASMLLRSAVSRFHAQALVTTLWARQVEQQQLHREGALKLLRSASRRFCAQAHVLALLEQQGKERHHQRQVVSAVQIQAVWRGKRARKPMKALLQARQRAAICIQGLLHLRRARLLLRTLRLDRASRESQAAITLQRWFRGHLVRKRTGASLQARRRAILRIQRFVRLRRARLHAKLQRIEMTQREKMRSRAATTIQRRYRGKRTRGRWRPVIARRRCAAVCIQGLLHVRRARLAARSLREKKHDRESLAAIVIQKWVRGRLCRKHLQPVLLERRRATQRIQGLFRARAARKEASRLRTERTRQRAARRIQGLLRVRRARLRARSLRLQRDNRELAAAIVMQRWFRGHACRKRLQPVLLQRRRATPRIQALFRGRRARLELRRLRAERAALQARAATVVQRWCRGYLARKSAVPLLHARRRATSRIRGLLYLRRARLEARSLRAERAARQARAATVLQRHCRGWQCRRRVRPLLHARRLAALRIQGLLHLRRARLEARKRRAEVALRRDRAATLLQSWWRVFLVRRSVLPLLKARREAALRIQGLAHIRRARQTAKRLREQQATLQIKAFLRAAAAKRRVMLLREERAAMCIQASWRSIAGRREGMRRRAEAVTGLLDSLCKGDVPVGIQGMVEGTYSAAWVERVTAALKWRDQDEKDSEGHELVARRRLDAEKLESGLPSQDEQAESSDDAAARHAARAAMDRELAAYSAAHTRAQLRRRALLLTQVAGGCDTCDVATSRALSVNDGLLARLRVDDAAEEIASIMNAAWAVSAVSRTRRQRWAPLPLDALRSGLGALLGRLRAELAARPEAGGPGSPAGAEEDAAGAAAALAAEEAGTARKAEERARGLRQELLDFLAKERLAAEELGGSALAAARGALESTTAEVAALRQKREAQADEAEAALRSEREHHHAQSAALEDLHLAAQVEKERLDAALVLRKPRARVFQRILVNVKKIQQTVREQEVNGKLNRSNRGILEHALRALESRATKALQGIKQTDHLVPVNKNEVVTEETDFQPSAALIKRQEAQASEEQRFRAALEAEVAKLRAESTAKMTQEVNVLGGRLSMEASVPGEEAGRLAKRIATWRRTYEDSRPWLGEVMPLAQASALAVAVGARVRAGCQSRGQEDQLLPATIRAAIPRLEAMLRVVAKVGPAESPRQGEFTELQSKLEAVHKAIAKLRAEYPNVVAAAPGSVEEGATEAGTCTEGAATSAVSAVQATAPQDSGSPTRRAEGAEAGEQLPAGKAPPAPSEPPGQPTSSEPPGGKSGPTPDPSPTARAKASSRPPAPQVAAPDPRAEDSDDSSPRSPVSRARTPVTPPISRLSMSASASCLGAALEESKQREVRNKALAQRSPAKVVAANQDAPPSQKAQTAGQRKAAPAGDSPGKQSSNPGRFDKVGAALRPNGGTSPFPNRNATSNKSRAVAAAPTPSMQRCESEPALKGANLPKPAAQKLATVQAQGPAIRAVQKARRNLAEQSKD